MKPDVVRYIEALIHMAKEETAREIYEMAKHELEYWEGSNTELFIKEKYIGKDTTGNKV